MNVAVVPDAVLFANISDRAVRLFVLLSLRPTATRRADLAAKLRCSVSSLDRAWKELEAIGAVAGRGPAANRSSEPQPPQALSIENRRQFKSFSDALVAGVVASVASTRSRQPRPRRSTTRIS